MKHIYYTLISGFVCILALVSPLDSYSQCSTCPGGTPSATEEHVFISDTTTGILTITFPKFLPSTGTLICVTLYDTSTAVLISGARNLDPVTGYTSSFDLHTFHRLMGPSVSSNKPLTKSYGPDSLHAYGVPTLLDSVTYGPDTIYNNITGQRTVTGTGAYLGTGNVTFTLAVTGGLVVTDGGLNYNTSIRGKIWGRFKLIYSYCPPAPLPEIFRQFTAVKQSNNNIQLSWSVSNDQISNSYEIEISSDGRNFTPAGKIASQYATEGASAKYNYQYIPDKDASGKLYFRIKQLSADGKGHYSAIRQVGISNNSPISFITYPNPVKNHVTIQSDRTLRGNYQLEMITSSGQQIMKHRVSLNNTSMIQWALPFQPAPGVYYIRTRELQTGQTASYKVLVNR